MASPTPLNWTPQLSERKQLATWRVRQAKLCAMFRKEHMRDDLRLLLQAVAPKRLSGLQCVGIAAEWMPHEWKVEAPAHLGLPDMGHLVDEERLPAERLFRKIVRPHS